MDDFTIRQGDTAAPIAQTLTDEDDQAVNLQGATVRFKMWPEDGGTAKINAAAANDQVGAGTDGSKGKVHYQWGGTDTDTAGVFLAQWVVTFPDTRVQSFPNNLFLTVRVTESTPAAVGVNYVPLEDLKRTLELTGQSFADDDLRNAITAASRAVDQITGRVFYPHTGAATARTFDAASLTSLYIDDFYELSSVEWADTVRVLGTDFLAEPTDGPPWDVLRAYGESFPLGQQTVTVTAKWGWPAVPPQVEAATKLIAARLFRRPREAAFGVAGFGIEDGAAVYVSRWDPDVDMLLSPFKRKLLLV